VLRTPGGTVDEFDDPTDTDTVVASRLPAHISSRTLAPDQHFEPGSGQVTTVEVLTTRVQWQEGSFDASTDRVQDERTGDILTIDYVKRPRYGGMSGDHELVTRRVY
jgi:hypothetical protein